MTRNSLEAFTRTVSHLLPSGFVKRPRIVMELEKATEPERKVVTLLKAKFPTLTTIQIMGFLNHHEWDYETAAAAVKTAQARLEMLEPSIRDVAPFMRSGEGCKGPDGTWMLLEDMQGGVHRDLEGRAILVSIGMMHGSPHEMLMQQSYWINRVGATVTDEGKIPGVCFIMEIPGRGGRRTFRMADKGTQMTFEAKKRYYPVALYGGQWHFCGVPDKLAWIFNHFIRRILPAEGRKMMNLTGDFSNLKNFLPPESILKEWGGELEWNVDDYVAWRAQKEGILDLGTTVRRFDPRESKKVAKNRRYKDISSEHLLDFFVRPSMVGPIEKQGSGEGRFSSTKWKRKLLMLGPPGFLTYFDSEEVSGANRARRVIDLLIAFVEEDFAADDADTAKKWVSKLRTAIVEAFRMASYG